MNKTTAHAARRSSIASVLARSSAAFLVVALSACAFLGEVHAATGLTVQPVKVSYTISPGESVTGEITLTNAGDAAEIYPTVQDFIPLAGSSNIQFVARAPGVTSVKDWIALSTTNDFSFAVDQAKEVSYTISVPKDAEPGSHFGVILFKAVDAASASQQLQVGTQVGVLVLVTVPGSHLEKGKIDSFTAPGFVQSGPVGFDISFENTGTVYFEPKGQITITNMFGRIVGTVPVDGQVVLPTGVRDIAVSWPAGFLLGPYNANLVLYDGDGNQLTANTIHFMALPIWYILSFIVAIVIVYLLLVFLKRKVSFSVSLKK